MKKLIWLLAFCTWLVLPKSVLAVCPVCTVAVVAGLGLSRYLGIDDTISGLWIGGLILSSSFWIADWLHKKGLKIKIQVLNFALAAVFYLITLAPLFFTNVIGHPYNTIYGMDKLLFGTIIGSVIFLLAVKLDKTARKLYGKQFFVYQKVVFPVVSLIVMSLIFYIAI